MHSKVERGWKKMEKKKKKKDLSKDIVWWIEFHKFIKFNVYNTLITCINGVGAIFASRPSVALVIFFGLKSPTLEKHLSFFSLAHAL